LLKEFASLHSHSHFSVMDGICTPEEMVLTAKEKGLRSIALTDHGTAHGHADLYIAGKKHNQRVVYGVEAYVIHSLPEWHVLREQLNLEKMEEAQERDSNSSGDEALSNDLTTSKKLYRKGHLVLLACDREGLANLYELIYLSHRDGFYGKPRMDKEMLARLSRGIVASSACMGGVIAQRLWDLRDGRATWNDVKNEALQFQEIFGVGRFFLEIQLNESSSQTFINENLVRLSRETGIPLTATVDSHYTKPEEWEAQELLYMLRGRKTVKTRGDNWNFEVRQLYVKSPEEVWETFKKFPTGVDERTALEAFENTLRVDSLISDFEPDVHQRLVTLKDADGNVPDPFQSIGQRSIDGLKLLGLAEDERYKARLLYELKIIKEKGTSNYFNVLSRVIAAAKEEQWIGAGRGSAAASLVCYCLGITDLDPLQFDDLMFERFMDPSRSETPDIDTDFEDVDATKDMLRKMFGEQNVACLSTYGTFQIKGLLKDLSRVYDLDHNATNVLNKRIDQDLRVLYINQDKSTLVVKLEDIRRVSPAFNLFIETFPQVGKHLEKLYGRVRHVGRHAAGVIIGDNLPRETALLVTNDKNGNRIVQASFTEGIVNKNVSTMGFVKWDILSIATLRVIHHAAELVAQKQGRTWKDVREDLRPRKLDLNDQKVLKHVFWDGNFAGIFQFTNRGIRGLARRVHPDTFTDVSAISSLYRPGPLAGGYDDLYVENKRDPSRVTYPHPLLEDILRPTRGCVVFQEQLMKICNVLGKMSWKDVNSVRKVLLKKDKSKTEEFLNAENERLSGLFFKGCEENGLAKEPAQKLWKDLLAFGGYGFNAAHSHSYSVMTMQCAHLATYHPLEFYAALLTSGQSGELQQHAGDIKKSGVKLLPVDINASRGDYVLEDGTIRLSLSAVKGVGKSAIERITAGQPYSSFLDFLDRSHVTKTSIVPLIKVGAFEEICSLPVRVLEERYLDYVDPKRTGINLSLKKNLEKWLKHWGAPYSPDDYTAYEKMNFERELVGFSLRGSFFDVDNRGEKIETLAQQLGNVWVDVKDFLAEENEDLQGVFPLAVKAVGERPDKKGNPMAFLTFECMDGSELEAPAFSTLWKHVRGFVTPGKVFLVTLSRREDDMERLVVGKPGWAQSVHSATSAFIDVDQVTL